MPSRRQFNQQFLTALTSFAFIESLFAFKAYSRVKSYDIHNLDMDAAEKRSDGHLRVPVLEVQEALSKYGKNNHH